MIFHVDVLSWLAVLPSAGVIALIFYAPGAVVLLAARMPASVALALAPAASTAIGGASAIVCGAIGVGWNLVAFVVATVVAAMLAVLTRLVIRVGEAPIDTNPRTTRAGIVGVLVAVPIAVAPMIAEIRVPDRAVQTWDAIFHLNALRWIADTGRGSSLQLAELSEPRPGFYPAGWHDLVSLGIGAGLGSPTLLANLSALVIAGLVWPSALALLASRVTPKAPAIVLVAPIIGSCFAAFPARMLSYGTLWPNALSTALVPAVLAVLVMILDIAGARRRLLLSAVGLVALAGAVLAHPTAIFAVAFLGAPLLALRAWPRLTSLWRCGRRAAAVVLGIGVPLAATVVLVALLRVPIIANTAAYPRPAIATQSQAVGEALFDTMLASTGFVTTSTAWVLGALVIAGIVVAMRVPSQPWIAASWVIAVLLYALAAGGPSPLRFLVGFWYTDPVRLGALVPIPASILAAIATHWMIARASRFLHRRTSIRTHPVVTWAVVIALLGAGTVGFRAVPRAFELYRDYSDPLQRSWGLLSPSEVSLIRRAARKLPSDSITIGNPFNGSAFLYALADRRVMYPHVTANWGPTQLYLARNFRRLGSDPKVCSALNRLGIEYFYYDSRVYFYGNPAERIFSGLTPPRSGVSEIDRAGSAVLYRITGC